jgi:DNA-binding beta-propeller fold protein YncE
MRQRSYAALGLCLMLGACGPSEPAGLGSLLASVDRAVVVSPGDVTLDLGGTQQFSAQLIQNDQQKKAAFTWSSSDPSVASISATGLVTALSGGEATITATASRQLSGTAHVTVRRSPPQLVAHLPLGGAFGTTVSVPGTAWITQPSYGQVSRLDVATGTFTASVTAGPFPVEVSANADGSRIYVPSYFSNAMVTSIDTRTLTAVDTVFATPSPEDAFGITNTPAGDTVFAAITNGPLFKIDMTNHAVLARLDLPVALATYFEWNSSRTRLYASQREFDAGRVFEIDPASFTVLRTFETGGSPHDLQFSADESRLFLAANEAVIVWDVASNALVTTYPMPGCWGYGLLRTPDNAFLIVGCVLTGTVNVFDPTTGALIETLNVGGMPRDISWDPATHSIIIANESGWVDILR